MSKRGPIYYTDKDFTDAEVAANFAFPCLMILTDNAGKILKQTAYDLNGVKSVLEPFVIPDENNEDQELSYKPIDLDNWRTITINNTDPYRISLGTPFAGSFEITAVEGAKISGILGKVNRVWDGRFFLLKNSGPDILLTNEVYFPPPLFRFFSFSEDFVFKSDSYILLKIKVEGLEVIEFGKDIDTSLFMLLSDYVQDGKIRADKIANLSISQVNDLQDWLDLLSSAIDAEEVNRAAADILLQNQVNTNTAAIATNSNKISDLEVHQIVINTSTSITTNTVGSITGKSQHGRNVKINNGVNAINISCELSSDADFVASYTKLGAGAITFTEGAGVTINPVDVTKVLNGVIGSTACLTRNGNTYHLQISNR